jgi:hypothetical protein
VDERLIRALERIAGDLDGVKWLLLTVVLLLIGLLVAQVAALFV